MALSLRFLIGQQLAQKLQLMGFPSAVRNSLCCYSFRFGVCFVHGLCDLLRKIIVIVIASVSACYCVTGGDLSAENATSDSCVFILILAFK